MDFGEAIHDLDSRQPESMPGPSLDRIGGLVDLLDHPELTYPSIHVTGTNGKTTTTRIITALACAHGLVTGTYVSPHVESVTERLSICGRPMTEEQFAGEYERLVPYRDLVDVRVGRVTYFEMLTAMAYLWFADAPVGLGVFEVGMGGVWDATNLIRGDVAVLCPIGLDHVGILGNTVGEIAVEKAGIVKEGQIAVVREQRPEALHVIRARCEAVGATLLLEGEDFGVDERLLAVGGQALVLRGPYGTYDDVHLPLYGEPAARNAAAAVAAVESLLDRRLDERAVRTSLEGVTSPGRIEVVGRHPLTVLDGAHNPDAMAALAAALREAFRWERLHLVIAMFEDKDVESVVGLIAPLIDRAYVAPNASPRSASPERLAKALALEGVTEVESFDSVPRAVQAARSRAGPDDLVLVTGSFYTVGDARPLFVRA